MSDKPFSKLNELDAAIRLAAPIGMEEGVKLLVEFDVGFEMFNTRPYHNYETWSGGYRVIGRGDGAAMSRDEAEFAARRGGVHPETYIVESAEDLDDAVFAYARKRQEIRTLEVVFAALARAVPK